MEGIFFIVITTFGGYLAHKLEKMEAKIDILEERLARLEWRFPARKADIEHRD